MIFLLLGEMELDPCIVYEGLEHPSGGLKSSQFSLEFKLLGHCIRTEHCERGYEDRFGNRNL